MDFTELMHSDAHSGQPIFEQLRLRVVDTIRSGRLPAGTKLPTVRELASQLNLAANTVARAYRELERAGVVETRGRFGTFVAQGDPADAAMAVAARSYADVARSVGLGKVAALRYLDAAFGG